MGKCEDNRFHLTAVGRILAPAMFALAGFAAVVPAMAYADLVVYPEYPERIERDYAYAVTVTQEGGGPARAIPVYNHCEKSALSRRTRGGDVNRRFCEFAFSGAPVRVDIAVCEDVKSYAVFPSRLRLRHAFRDGVISVWLDRPARFGIRLNDYDKTILSVFADPPEDPADIPQRDDPGVLYVDGWLDADAEDGTITVAPPVREVYVAPGAVLNARLVVKTANARVHGRGMVLDPFSDVFRYDQNKNSRRFLLNVSGRGAVVEDVKLVDSRTFNFGSWADDVTFRNVKALSSMMCSDGITSGGRNLLVDGAWLYVGDNALVVSGLEDSTYRDVAIGTSCNAIFPQSANERVRMEGIDVFRADEGFVKNTYNNSLNRDTKWNELDGSQAKKQPGPQSRRHLSQSFSFRNLSAVDTVHFATFFVGGNMGTLPKTFAFENLTLPLCSGTDDWRVPGSPGAVAVRIYDDPAKWLVTDNYVLAITNLWIAGAPADGFPAGAVKNGHLVQIEVANGGSGRDASTMRPPIAITPNRAEPNWTCPWKVFVGGALRRDWRLVDRAAGERRLPPPPPGENLLADRPAVRSVWQRCPSWLVKFDATETDSTGARIYRLTQCERNAGILNVFTDAFLPRGNGVYRLSFDAAATAEAPVPLKAEVLSNEKRIAAAFTLPNDGAWHRHEADIVLDFDLPVTELAALFLSSGVPADEIRFRNLSLVKQ